MKIVFFGTSDFAVPALKALSSSKHTVLGIVTAPDKRKGRGQRVGFSPIKVFAQEKNLKIFQPTSLKDDKFLRFLKEEPADLFVVCAYGRILSKEVLQTPKTYAINLHPSLLPKYRGAAPISWAIIQGEKVSGITIFKMDEHMDRGEIILQKKTAISDCDTAISLAAKLASIAVDPLLSTLDLIEQKKVSFRIQDESKASYAPKLKKEDGLIDWRFSALEIHNRIRGLQPWPGAFTYLENKILKIWQSQIIPGEGHREPAEILEIDAQKGILLQTGKGKILLTVLQIEGKRKMSAREFTLGHRIEVGVKLGKMKGERDGKSSSR